MRLLIAFIFISLAVIFPQSAQAQTPAPQQLSIAPRWSVYVPGTGQMSFYNPREACYRQMKGSNGSGFLEPVQVNFKKYACKWQKGRILPGYAVLVCTGGGDPVEPGFCPSNDKDRPECEQCGDAAPQSGPPSPKVGNPISLQTGTKEQLETDYASEDGLLRVDRQYRSRLRGAVLYSTTEPSGFAQNWLGIIPGRLTVASADASTVEYLPSSGTVNAFKVASPGNLQDYNYQVVGSSRLRLSVLGTPTPNRTDYMFTQAEVPGGPAEFRLDYSNGDYILFRRVGSVTSISPNRYAVPIEKGWASGYKQFFDYNAGSESPYRIRDSFNRQLNVNWVATNSDDGQLGKSDKAVDSISLPDGTSLKYDYDNGGTYLPPGSTTVVKDRLISVKRLSATNAVLWQRSYLYERTDFPYALTGIVDGAGNRLATYGYSSTGVANSTEHAGGVDKWQVNSEVVGSTFRRTVTNPLGRQSVYEFSIPSITSPYSPAALNKVSGAAIGSVPADIVQFAYGSGLVSSMIDAKGNITNVTNDNVTGRPSLVTEAVNTAQQRATTLTWHPTFDLPTREERPGLQVDYGYDTQGRLISRTETDTTTQTVPYSSNGQTRTSTFAWTNEGRLSSINGPLPVNGLGQDDVTSFAYDASGNLTAITNALGQTVQFDTFDANGRAGRSIDANGVITLFAFDPLGRLTTITRKHPTDPLKDAVTTLDYDAEGRVTGVTAPLTDKLSMAYDLAGRLLSISAPDGEKIEYGYDAMGDVTSQTVKRANGSTNSSITRTFDALGRMLSETLGAGRTSTFGYDKNDNLVSVTSARGNAVTASFDALDRLVTNVAPGSATSTNAYNAFDDATSFSDPLTVTTGFVRNGFGEVIRETSPDRGVSDFYYDAAGELTARIDGRGQRVDYSYDILGRLTAKSPQGLPAEAVTYTYDSGTNGVGRLTSVVDASGTTSFTYDHRGNLLSKTQNLGGSAATLSYAYDLADRIVSITYPSGRIVDYARDSKGRVSSVTTRDNATATPVSLMANADYESFGSLKTATFGNGTALLQDWGNDGLLAQKRLYRTGNNSNLSLLDYSYDLDDNITGISDGVTPTSSQSFAYDNRGRLIRADSGAGTYRRQDYVYDANGNRTAVEWRNLPSDAAPAKSDAYTRTSGTNRLASLTNADGTRSFVQDNRGNLISESRPDGLGGTISVAASYDGYGRLTGYVQGSSPALTMTYNGLDDRVSESKPVGSLIDTKRYVYDSQGRLIGEYGGGASAIHAEYIYFEPDAANDAAPSFGGDDGMGGYGLLAIMAPDTLGQAQPLWVQSNHLGAPMFLVDGNGIEAAPGDYAQIMFPGQMRTLADVYYNRYRDYDPTIGRYIQADPIGLAGGSNPYLYAKGNPLRYTDPTGKCPACYLLVPFAEAAIPIVIIGGGGYIIYKMFNRDPAMPFVPAVGPYCPPPGDQSGDDEDPFGRLRGNVETLPSSGTYGGNIPTIPPPVSVPSIPLPPQVSAPPPLFNKPPKDATDPTGAKAPGPPGADDGFLPPKKGPDWAQAPNGQWGWPDRKGDIWVPTGPGGHGGPHWDVNGARGGSRGNVYPGGKRRPHGN